MRTSELPDGITACGGGGGSSELAPVASGSDDAKTDTPVNNSGSEDVGVSPEFPSLPLDVNSLPIWVPGSAPARDFILVEPLAFQGGIVLQKINLQPKLIQGV